jgi:hypothetical protein
MKGPAVKITPMKSWNPIYRITALVTGVCASCVILGAVMGLGVYYMNALIGGSL